ncbi:MAG: hypothetical protein HYR90_01810 [Candidatus Andersenbacteria bacterium]|nr:hypothetical protein [Candidatus Andersenbacteria bacterium]MBI3250896.1 hypothetical protein [Candidatus Andersenbacteria bacterium]
MLIQFLAGLALLLVPFLLGSSTSRFRFVLILSGVIGFHTIVALTTQSVHFFTYPVLLTIHLIALLILGFVQHWHIHLPSWRHFDYMAVIVVVISILYLGAAHFYYTGPTTDIASTVREVKNSRDYPYPYYVDEWYAIAFIKQAIATKSLPVGNPLTNPPAPFPNFEAATHSFLANLTLLLNLDPVQHYTAVSVAFNTIIVLLLYLILREQNVHSAPAALASLGSLYIVSGANLPGLWTLVPLTMGLVGLFCTLFFLSRHTLYSALLGSIITLLFYPPLILFLVPALGVALLTATNVPSSTKRRITLLSLSAAILTGIVVVLFFVASSPESVRTIGGFISYVWQNALLYQNFTEGGIPHYSPFTIIPWPLVAAASIGIYFAFRQKRWWLLAPLAVSILLWLIYSFTPWHVLIGQQRTIITASLLITLAAGFGFSTIFRYALYIMRSFPHRVLVVRVLSVAVPLFFLILLPTYTSRTHWKKLTLTHPETGQLFRPAAPANRYLHPDDVRIFSNISGQKFLSLPWKGTVIGTATGNFPAATKSGTISLDPTLPDRFRAATCKQKKQIAERNNLTYIYLPAFECPHFAPLETSSEDLTLYQVSS